MELNKKDILKLKEETGAGVMAAKNALEENKGDYEKAKEYLMKKSLEKAEKRSERETSAGLVWSYIHGSDKNGGRIGSLVKVSCETDFVAKTDDFQNLCKEIAMQVSAMNPESVEELMEQEYIRDNSKTVEKLVKETIAKVGENIQVVEFSRLEI